MCKRQPNLQHPHRQAGNPPTMQIVLTALLLAFAACGDGGTPLPGDPSAHQRDAGLDGIEPILTIDQVDTATAALIGQALNLDVPAVLDAWQSAFSHRDDDCPMVYTETNPNLITQTWNADCETEDGTVFTGFGLRATANETGVGELNQLAMSGQIETAGGRLFEAAGFALDGAGTFNGITVFLRMLDGTFRDTESDSPVLLGGANATLNVLAGFAEDFPDSTQTMVIEGGITSADNDVSATFFTNVVVQEAPWDFACPVRVRGTVSARDRNGQWYDVTLDNNVAPGGTTEAAVSLLELDPLELLNRLREEDNPLACDRCGPVWFRGEQIGETCIDTDPLLDWEGQPWQTP